MIEAQAEDMDLLSLIDTGNLNPGDDLHFHVFRRSQRLIHAVRRVMVGKGDGRKSLSSAAAATSAGEKEPSEAVECTCRSMNFMELSLSYVIFYDFSLFSIPVYHTFHSGKRRISRPIKN